MSTDTVLKLASSSKFITTIAVLQAVERGLVGLDDDVAQYVPVLAEQEVLQGFAWYGKPRTVKRTKKITLRHLLTQTAGTGYDFLPIQPIARYKTWNRMPIGQGDYIDDRMAYPLLHEPGLGWTYGSSMTWAGKVLEKVSGMTLDEWTSKHICEPLGLTSVTFFPGEELEPRMADVVYRHWWSGKLLHLPGMRQPESEKEALGGESCFASMDDLMAVLQSLLMDDEKLLKKETTAMMFSPQLDDMQRQGLWECLDKPVWICQTILKKGEYDWGVGGVLINGDSHECLQRGTLMWSGLFHVLWVSLTAIAFWSVWGGRLMVKQWIDRKSGVSGVFGTQLLPGTDKIVVPLIGDFQREVYRRFHAKEY